MKVLQITLENKYLQIFAEGEALCVNTTVEYDGKKYRVLSCRSFVHDTNTFKATCIQKDETTTELKHIRINKIQ